MAYKYNAYLKITKSYLQNLPYYEEAVRNLDAVIRDLKIELAGVSVKTTNFSGMPGGGNSELNGVERDVESRIKCFNDYQDRIHERAKLLDQIHKLRRAMDLLPETEREVLHLYYTDKQNYTDIANQVYQSERTCRRFVKEGTEKIALSLFGDKALASIRFIS